MAQYPIPQFIEEEGKIISFLTYRQFFTLVGGGGAIILLYWIIPWFPVFIILAILTALLAGALAFLKIGNQGIVGFMLGMVGFTLRPKTYTWKKKEGGYRTDIKKAPDKKQTSEPIASPSLTTRPSKLQQTQKMVETKK